MEANFEYIDGLIAKSLAGEASREEVDRLEGWINELPQNKAYFEDTKRLFNTIDAVKTEQPVSVEAAWQKLNKRIAEPEAKVVPLKRRYNALRVAASLLLVLALTVLIKMVFYPNTEVPMVLAASNKAVEKKLPDGSKVLINKNSEISYVVSKGRREVQLKGEAYFEVVHNEKEPFVITIGDVSIQDIGTAFNVKAIPGSRRIEVFVEEGEVSFYTTNNPGVKLVKGQKAVYDIDAKSFVMNDVDPTENTASYHSKQFYFKESTLLEVLAQINTVYESNISLADEKMGNCRLSVEFHNEDLEVILSIIAETLDMQVEQTGGAIVLKGGICPH